MSLTALGWDDSWAEAFAPYAGLVPARVTRVDKGACLLLAADGELRAGFAPPGGRSGTGGPADPPSVGDWAAVRARPDGGYELAAVLARRTAFVRGAVGRESRGGLSGDSRGQVLAANIDVAFIAEPAAIAAEEGPEPDPGDGPGAAPRRGRPATGTADLGRVERLLALTWESGAVPVVLITKADLAAAPDELLAAVSAAAPGVDVHAVSALTGDGVDVVRSHLGAGDPARTAVVLGASGAGKSTLVNALAGAELMKTQQIRASDGRGRHTTTHRELIRLPGGGLVIDTPGLRRIGLFDTGDGLSRTFADIAELAAECRFGDCSHRHEPGCAVLAAVAAGELAERRLASWYKLRREAEWIASRTDARLRSERTRRWKQIHMEHRRSRRHGR